MKDRKGFTLVELLLVVAILAFLIAIIVIASSEIGKDSHKKAMYTSLRNLKQALETYNVTNSSFPTDKDTLSDNLTIGTTRLINSIPVDTFNPTPNAPVGYYRDPAASGFKETYVAFSVGDDGDAEITGAWKETTGGTPTTVPPDITVSTFNDIYVTNARGKEYKP